MTNNYKFTRNQRLLTAKEYATIFDNKDNFRFATANFSLIAKSNDKATPRLGIVVSKKAVKLAHERNRIKRLVREYFRLHTMELPNVDLVFMARHNIQFQTTEIINNEFGNCYRLLQRFFSKTSIS